MDIRRIERADLPACSAVFFAAEDDLYDRRGLPHLPRNVTSLERLFGHLLETDPERAWLAEHDGRVTAFGMATLRDRFWFLSFLFVRPEAQSQGLGRRLMQRCLPADDAADVLGVCVEAIQPISTGLYAAFGLVPRMPIYTLIGTPRTELPALPDAFTVEPFDELAKRGHEQLVDIVAGLDRHVLGYTRPNAHRAFRLWERSGLLLRNGEQPVGYGYASPSGRLGPVVVVDSRQLLPLVGELTRRVGAVDAWQILVPGPAAETMVALLRAGLRYDGPPALFCATHPGPDLERYLPGTFAIL
ncbi:MAG TPA: GNAT family N-acetyltransferase [Candidatus Caenarcaniphilales bacterium]|nr:GNAT family N-acetyltransferase [Candidatus Caenarcaniphilales bacterium]